MTTGEYFGRQVGMALALAYLLDRSTRDGPTLDEVHALLTASVEGMPGHAPDPDGLQPFAVQQLDEIFTLARNMRGQHGIGTPP